MSILPQLLVNALIAGSIYALATCGLSLTYGLLKILNFAHGHLLMTGAYIFYLGTVDLELGLFPAALITIGIMLILAQISLRVFVSPFTKYALILPFVTTLALSIILESLVSILFGVNVKSLSIGSVGDSYEFYGIYITPLQILILISSLVLFPTMAFLIHSTGFGRTIRAVSEHPEAAEALGINGPRLTSIVFSAGVLLAAFAGILVGFETNLQPTMGSSYTIKAFACMVLGGLGNLWGALAGSYLLGLIENLAIGIDFGPYSLPAGYKDAFAFAIILLVLLFRPQGLFSKATRRA